MFHSTHSLGVVRSGGGFEPLSKHPKTAHRATRPEGFEPCAFPCALPMRLEYDNEGQLNSYGWRWESEPTEDKVPDPIHELCSVMNHRITCYLPHPEGSRRLPPIHPKAHRFNQPMPGAPDQWSMNYLGDGIRTHCCIGFCP